MIDGMQRFAQNSVVKVLLIGLIGTFAVWGVGDMLRSGSGKAVAVIGDEEISQYEFATILQREVQALQPLFN
jgi:peptidyl-prolyl cis-trans isomerase D